MTKTGPNLLNPQCLDHLIRNQGQKGMALLDGFINQAHGIGIDPQIILPDYRGEPLDEYLIPGKVVLVHPLSFKNPVLLSNFLEDQVGNLGVRGFVFTQASSITEIYRYMAPWFSVKQSPVFFSIQISLGQSLPDDESFLSGLFSAGLRLIIWEKDTKSARISEKILWAASKIGIWNHVASPDLFGEQWNNEGPYGKGDQDLKFIVNNPNIVHSFQNFNQDKITDFIQDKLLSSAVPAGLMEYAKVQPLPGIPFWNILGNPVCLLAYLNKMTKKVLGSLRVNLATQSVIYLGSQMVFIYQSPKDLPPEVLDEICKMVDAGGSVDITHVRSNLEKAHLIGYAMENGVIIGNSSLKHPRKVFMDRLKQMTGVDFTNFVERGYTSVRPEYRAMGVGARLLDGLTKRVENHRVFSIISEDNLATQKIALRNNTKKILTYFSGKLKKEMGVWMPVSMIDRQLSQMDSNQKDREK